jgi:hypothetical protein
MEMDERNFHLYFSPQLPLMGKHATKPPEVYSYKFNAAVCHLGGLVIFGTFGFTAGHTVQRIF